ncbi:uncharacterized protein LOC128315752 [Acinonyx jubatus]|uniref:Uncharacterized protein LOC128315752 n=1 Tax=Acinonyx jubatus TaxID=32536 RepID=A0ABM3Q5U2_ACIJB|nr:uncharacterized protein LOC128315752 [Acinonyx jubatus]
MFSNVAGHWNHLTVTNRKPLVLGAHEEILIHETWTFTKLPGDADMRSELRPSADRAGASPSPAPFPRGVSSRPRSTEQTGLRLSVVESADWQRVSQPRISTTAPPRGLVRVPRTQPVPACQGPMKRASASTGKSSLHRPSRTASDRPRSCHASENLSASLLDFSVLYLWSEPGRPASSGGLASSPSLSSPYRAGVTTLRVNSLAFSIPTTVPEGHPSPPIHAGRFPLASLPGHGASLLPLRQDEVAKKGWASWVGRELQEQLGVEVSFSGRSSPPSSLVGERGSPQSQLWNVAFLRAEAGSSRRRPTPGEGGVCVTPTPYPEPGRREAHRQLRPTPGPARTTALHGGFPPPPCVRPSSPQLQDSQTRGGRRPPGSSTGSQN